MTDHVFTHTIVRKAKTLPGEYIVKRVYSNSYSGDVLGWTWKLDRQEHGLRWAAKRRVYEGTQTEYFTTRRDAVAWLERSH